MAQAQAPPPDEPVLELNEQVLKPPAAPVAHLWQPASKRSLYAEAIYWFLSNDY